MLKCLSLMVFLLGCASFQRHSFLIYDKDANQCWYLYNSTLAIEERATWYNFNGKQVRTGRNFDLRVVDDEDYKSAATSMDIDLKGCANGLVKN